MRLLLDTNIVLDILLERKEFLPNSKQAIIKAMDKGDKLFLSCSAVTDIYYIIRKNVGSKEIAYYSLKDLAIILNFADVNEKCILNAIESKISDFEDAVVDAVAINTDIDYIITRNIEHFKNATTKILTPEAYLKLC